MLGTQFPHHNRTNQNILSALKVLDEAHGNCCPSLSFDCPTTCQSLTADTSSAGSAKTQSYQSEQVLSSHVNYQRGSRQTLATTVSLANWPFVSR